MYYCTYIRTFLHANVMNVISTDGNHRPTDEDLEALQSLQSDFQKCAVRFFFL